MNVSHLRDLLSGRGVENAVMAAFVVAFLFELIRIRRTPHEVSAREARRKLHPAVLFLPLLVLVNALDVKGYFLNGRGFAKYGFSALFLVLCLLARRRGLAVHGLTRLAAVLFVLLSLGGAVLGVLYVHPVSSGLPIGAASVFLLTPMVAGKLDERQCEWLLSTLMITCLLELFVNFLASAEYIGSGINRTVGPASSYSNGTFTHEKVAIAFMALHLAFRRGGLLLKLATPALMVVVFANYPAGTYVIASVAYVVLLIVMRLRGRVAVAVVGGVALLSFFAVTFVTGGGGTLEQHYYTAVGKTDNTSSRSILWQASLKAIDRHSWLGSRFTGEGSVVVHVGNLPPIVPPHNDYLELALLGGWVAVVLFGLVVFGYLRELDHGALRRSGKGGREVLAATLAVGVFLFLVSMIFNPSLLKVSLAALMFSLLGVAASVGVRADRPVAEAAEPSREPVLR